MHFSACFLLSVQAQKVRKSESQKPGVQSIQLTADGPESHGSFSGQLYFSIYHFPYVMSLGRNRHCPIIKREPLYW